MSDPRKGVLGGRSDIDTTEGKSSETYKAHDSLLAFFLHDLSYTRWKERRDRREVIEMRLATLLRLMLTFAVTTALAYSQDVHYDYERCANFSAYKTYQWVGTQLIDQEIKHAVNEQLAQKGLKKVDKNADLHVGYNAAIRHEQSLYLPGDFMRMRGSLYGGILSYFFLLTGVLAFLAWMRNHDQKLFLWFAIWPLAKVTLYYLSFDRVIALIPTAAFNCLLLVLHSIVDCSVFLLLLYLFNLQRNPRLRRWTWIAIAFNVSFGLGEGLLTLFWQNAGRNLQLADGTLTAAFQLSELFVFVLVYQGLRSSLDVPRKLVAVMAFLVYSHEIVRLLSLEGRRFSHWNLYERMSSPLFHIFGAGITSRQILETTLILSVAHALICYVLEHRKHEMAIEMELKSAGEVQRIMIPEIVPDVPGYTIASVYRPAAEVGGDFFQIIPREDRSTLVVLGDVSGKGLKAAMNVSLIVGTLRALAESNTDPASILTGLNRLLTGRLQGGFVTALVFRVDDLGVCKVANAGHLEPFLNGEELKIEGSPPLGIFLETEYDQQRFTMSEGDCLTIYTDGVLEARNEQDELYGLERTRMLLGGNPSAEFIAETARAFGQDDDITVLTIHRDFIAPMNRLDAGNQIS